MAHGIHRLPESVVKIGRKLMLGREPLERLVLPKRSIAVDVVEDLRGEHEKAAIDPPAVTLWLFREFA